MNKKIKAILLTLLLIPNKSSAIPESLESQIFLLGIDVLVSLVIFLILLNIILLIFKKIETKKYLIICSFILILLFLFCKNCVSNSKIGEYVSCFFKNGNVKVGTCYIKSSDYNKPCESNCECEGFCAIENEEQFMKDYKFFFSDSTSNTISIKEFEEKTKSKVSLSCSKYKNSYDCLPGINENGLVRVRGWDVPNRTVLYCE